MMATGFPSTYTVASGFLGRREGGASPGFVVVCPVTGTAAGGAGARRSLHEAAARAPRTASIPRERERVVIAFAGDVCEPRAAWHSRVTNDEAHALPMSRLMTRFRLA